MKRNNYNKALKFASATPPPHRLFESGAYRDVMSTNGDLNDFLSKL